MVRFSVFDLCVHGHLLWTRVLCMCVPSQCCACGGPYLLLGDLPNVVLYVLLGRVVHQNINLPELAHLQPILIVIYVHM